MKYLKYLSHMIVEFEMTYLGEFYISRVYILAEGRYYFHVPSKVYLGHSEEVDNVDLQASGNSFGS